MNHSKSKNSVCVLGIDIGKTKFQLCGLTQSGHKVIDRQLTRKHLPEFVVNLAPCLIGIESCSGANYWARLFRGYGHEVRLIAPQFVKPFVKSNKNDRADAEAICEAIQRPGMRFVAIKEIEQQDVQSLHRIRSQVLANRTALVNQIRSLLHEYGINLPPGRRTVRTNIVLVLEDAANGLTTRFRHWLSDLLDDLIRLDERIENLDKEILQIARSDERSRRLMQVPGIGPMCATALLAAVGDIKHFRNGRELAAWVGLVPRQYSTGGKPTLLGISKRGDVYLRQLLVHGARVVVRRVDGKTKRHSVWLSNLLERRHKNVATVAVANKMVRTAYALLKHGTDYHPVAGTVH